MSNEDDKRLLPPRENVMIDIASLICIRCCKNLNMINRKDKQEEQTKNVFQLFLVVGYAVVVFRGSRPSCGSVAFMKICSRSLFSRLEDPRRFVCAGDTVLRGCFDSLLLVVSCD